MKKRIVTIGGGGGHSQVLKGLKNMRDIVITGICPSTDSGGSTGVLQKEYDGSGYIGDLTKCTVALCGDDVLAKALMFRYENGPLDAHSVKNLLFHALEKVSTPKKALETMSKVCDLGPHRILPATNEKTELCARLSVGSTISGETNIDTISKNPLWNPDIHSISDIYLKPAVKASKDALESVKEADYIVVCPGDLYSSIIPVLLPKGMKEAIKKSRAKVIIILNIMTKKGETDNYTAADFVRNIEIRLGRRADYVVCNNATIPRKTLLKYALENKVAIGSLRETHGPRIILAPMAMIGKDEQIYSNPEAVRKAIENILSREE